MKVKQLFNFDTVNVQPVNGQGIVRITEFQYNQPLILYLIIEMDHHQQGIPVLCESMYNLIINHLDYMYLQIYRVILSVNARQ